MGTSTSSKGANNRSPLVPPWADVDGKGPGPKPEPNRFQGFRTSLGRFVATGDGESLRKGLRAYAQTSTGGSANGPRRFGAMAQAGSGLFDALNALRTNPAAAPFNLGALAGHSTRELIDALAGALVPVNGDAERIRVALTEALATCLEGVEDFDFASITEEIIVELMVAYTALCVFEQIVLDSNEAFTKAESTDRAREAEKELWELVQATTDKHMQPLLQDRIGQMSQADMQAAQLAAIKEVWSEWEGFEP
ncbi:hypothetical protein LMG19144_00558 [Xanthomonas arboricola pv. fragariae]|uniref:hypothetical protein n=2 Tax=Xanthomonas TaxID=338 RepID=UPI00096FB8B3|nr:hypothetical protein [Xanthomonas campestris]MEA9620193.1 hypothetical protein [Xanthomonas campestris pv. incanae]SOU05520.1 hypothetical protein LMG19144_00558 [Xanthomonas arboricola pv. fragariae]SOU09572.1 hypothetical protein LMG19145_00658 [Xanthomonas arboricola pv. fragariae]